MTGLQINGEFIDSNGLVLGKDDRDKILDTIGELPINEHIKEIQESVAQSTITIISAETGSGKTTQVPKMIMNMGNIVVVEPRVIAAIGAAKRVSRELLTTTLNQIHSIGNNIGYQTGRGKRFSNQSGIIYGTDGYQLLNQFVGGINPDVLIIDEVHTFSVATEFLIAQVKKLMQETSTKIKLILMSATIDTKLLSKFFQEIEKNIPVLKIPGRTFPVEKEFRNGEKFIPSILELATKKNNILVFVEGKKQIESVIGELSKSLPDYDIFPLHSELPIEEQTKLLNYSGNPTIIVATNIAQESITVDYINAVVDNGFCKVLKVNSVGVPELFKEPISKADSLQRAGRAGRVMPGKYIRANDIPFEDLNDYPTGEIENLTLERYVLISLASGFDPLKEIKTGKNIFIHNPNRHLLELTYKNLRKLKAIDKDNQVTEIGNILLSYPLDPKLSIMLLNGVKRNCSGNIIEIVSIINHNGFIGKTEEWKNFVSKKSKKDSDLLALTEFLKIVSSEKTLSKSIVSKLKKLSINQTELKIYQGIKKIGEIIDNLLLKFEREKQNNLEQFDLFEIIKIKKLAQILEKNIKENPIIDIKVENEIKEILKLSRELIEKIKKGEIKEIDKNFIDTLINLKKNYKLFEIVDLTGLGVKTRRVYEILNTIGTLKDRLDEQGVGINYSDNIDDIIMCLMSGLGEDLYIWDRKTKMFYNNKKGGFQLPKSSVIENININDYYIGSPFIIGSTDENLMPLLFYITRVSDFHIKEAITENEEMFKGIEFHEKNEDLKDNTMKYLVKDSLKLSLSDLASEIVNQGNLEDILSFHWLPDFLIQNNKSIKKYIRTKRDGEFNVCIFKKLLTIFTGDLVKKFDVVKIQKTLNDYIYNETLLNTFLESEDNKVKEFLENPYKKEYSFELDILSLKLSEKQKEFLDKLKKVKVRNIQVRGKSFDYMKDGDNSQEIEKIGKGVSEKKQKSLEKRIKKQEFYEKIRELKDKLKEKEIDGNIFIEQIIQLEEKYGIVVKNIEDIFINIQIENKIEEDKEGNTMAQFRYKKKLLRKLARLRSWDDENYNRKLQELYIEFGVQSLDEKREELTKKQLLVKLEKARRDIKKLLSQARKENINIKSIESNKKRILTEYGIKEEQYENYIKEENARRLLISKVYKEIKQILNLPENINLPEEDKLKLKNEILEKNGLRYLIGKERKVKEEKYIGPLKPRDKTGKLSRKRKKKLKN
ncbi:MAG: helicase-related protein [Candidatus Gracilibacteria bacterium]|nr:helicase-related protein [Candidatus Gracilibacteria bacterium]